MKNEEKETPWYLKRIKELEDRVDRLVAQIEEEDEE
tara:strand:- start:675 stop:782 length:108 start_codon:yes stop_codon:yes gene_type:complete